MERVYKVKTENNAHITSTINYHVIADSVLEATKKVEVVLNKEFKLISTEFLFNLDEDSDLEEYKKELLEDQE